MSENRFLEVGPTGRWIVFGGVGAAILSACDYLIEPLNRAMDNHTISSTTAAYIIAGVASVILVGAMVSYNYCPRRLTIPLGIIGWILAFIQQFCFFWFGAGALKS